MIDWDMVLQALQRVVDEAAAKGIGVKVEIHERGFFPSEGIDVTITATPRVKSP